MDIRSTSHILLDGMFFEQMDPAHLFLSYLQLIPDSIACRLYLLTVLIETAIDLAIEADLLIRFHEVDKSSPDNEAVSRKMPVYLTIFALAQYDYSL